MDGEGGPRRRHELALGALVVAWLAGVVVGISALISYSNTAGEPGDSPRRWPGSNAIRRSTERPTLVMFVHPRCPCSTASVAELARLLAYCGENLAAHVVFFTPPESGAAWSDGEVAETARAITGVAVHVDAGARMAQAFGAETSGHTVVYGAGGELLLSGGITAGRGHEGDSAGGGAVRALVAGGTYASRLPVFGCAIVDDRRAIGDPECRR